MEITATTACGFPSSLTRPTAPVASFGPEFLPPRAQQHAARTRPKPPTGRGPLDPPREHRNNAFEIGLATRARFFILCIANDKQVVGQCTC